MRKPPEANKMSTLRVLIPTAVYRQMRRAARMRGMSLTAYVITAAGDDARRTIEESEVIRMARADQIRFAEAIARPGRANNRLKQAASLHAALIVRQ